MTQKKYTKLRKWYLKYTNRPAYISYKAAFKNSKLTADLLDINTTLDRSLVVHKYKELTRFMHSGNSGDIIYSLPTIWELAKKGQAEIYLQADQPGLYNNYHPLGNVMLNQKMIEMLRPLLLYQPRCSSCEMYQGEVVDYNMDKFRELIRLQDRGNIARWYFYVYAVFAALHEPWLDAPPDSSTSDAILIARSHRYRNPHINYSFLRKYPKLQFIGVEEEYFDLKSVLPQLEFRPVANFLEMASMIKSCKMFIGNQSFPFSLAEALKATRVLEVFYQAPNVIVEGKGGHDFLYQPQFEKIVQTLYDA